MSLAELKIDKEKPLTHEDVRVAVTKFMESDDCIMADYWIEQHFCGSQERQFLMSFWILIIVKFQILQVCAKAQKQQGMD